MRDKLRKLGELPDHRGLAHDVWAPEMIDRKSEMKHFETWLDKITGSYEPRHYHRALARWTRSLQGPDDLIFHARTRGRLLVGHGNTSPSDVGITLHRTWGVPLIPGSSLAGLLAHYVAITLGPGGSDDPGGALRAPFHPGLRDERGSVTAPPGDAYAYLFGVPPHRDAHGKLQARRGALIVHDALWAPDGDMRPLARDVLTVHQRDYYGGTAWPGDGDNPNPVPFVSVPAGTWFVFALSCPDTAWRQWALEHLQQALASWGIGGKTAAGYGRFGDVRVPEDPRLAGFIEALEEKKQQKVTQQEMLAWIEATWLERLRELWPRHHEGVARLLRKHISSRKRQEQCERLLALLGQEPR